MKKLGFLKAIVVVTAVGFCASGAKADLITNGGFETGDFTGWTVSAGATGVSNSFDGFSPNSGTYFAYLGDTSQSYPYGTLSQTISDNSGDSLLLSYFLASDGATPNYFEADWNGSAIAASIVQNTGAFPYTQYQFIVTATGSDELTFHEQNVPAYDALDDVSLTPTTDTPAPGALALLGFGLLGIGALRRKMKAL